MKFGRFPHYLTSVTQYDKGFQDLNIFILFYIFLNIFEIF